MSFSDVNSNPDFNEYDYEDYKELGHAGLGETATESYAAMPFIIGFALIVLLLTLLYYLVFK